MPPEQQTVLKEEAIRPADLMAENAALHCQDVALLLEHQANFVMVDCPACECPENSPRFEKNGFRFVTCTQCETVFINPRPSRSLLDRYYQQSKSIQHWNDKIFPASESARRHQIFEPRAEQVIRLCHKHQAQTQVLLDAGAGFGTFCEAIQGLNVFDEVIAVEPSPDLARTCRQKGIQVIESPIETVRLENISVITNFELIEHLFQPKDFLLGCHQALPTGGLLMLTTPNVRGFDLMLLQHLSGNMAGPNHLNYFHPASLQHLLERCGFRVLEILTPGKLDAELVHKKIESGEFDVSQQPFLKHVLLDEWNTMGEAFQQFLAKNRLSSHLWMVAQKR